MEAQLRKAPKPFDGILSCCCSRGFRVSPILAPAWWHDWRPTLFVNYGLRRLSSEKTICRFSICKWYTYLSGDVYHLHLQNGTILSTICMLTVGKWFMPLIFQENGNKNHGSKNPLSVLVTSWFTSPWCNERRRTFACKKSVKSIICDR